MKIVVIIIPTDLVTNSLLSSFCPYLQPKKQESGFEQVGGLVTKNICFLFIVSRAILESHTEFNKLL